MKTPLKFMTPTQSFRGLDEEGLRALLSEAGASAADVIALGMIKAEGNFFEVRLPKYPEDSASSEANISENDIGILMLLVKKYGWVVTEFRLVTGPQHDPKPEWLVRITPRE